MKRTVLLKVDPEAPEIEKIRVTAKLINSGGLVAFPTETVYGLGADAFNVKAVTSLFEVKKRPLDNPPIVHVCDTESVFKVAREVPPVAEKLVKMFWPGPLTLVLRRSRVLPDVTVASLDTVAVRMPRHSVALRLISECGCPISAPSANLAGRPSPTTARHVLDDLGGRIDAVLDGGPTMVGVESTVLDVTVEPAEVLRPGGITVEMLRKVLGDVKVNPAVTSDAPVPVGAVRSPGLKHKHYAPDACVVVVEGELSLVLYKMNELAAYYMKRGSRVGILCSDETFDSCRANVVKSMGTRRDLGTVARRLFACLREFDLEGVDVIVAEGVPLEGLGLAVMNRLRRAAGYKIVTVT